MDKRNVRPQGMEFIDRTTSYRVRPVSRVQPRYRTSSPEGSSRDSHQALPVIEDILVKPHGAKVVMPAKQTLHHTPARFSEMQRQLQPVNRLTTSVRPKSATQKSATSQRQHIALAEVPTLPLGKQAGPRRFMQSLRSMPSSRKRGYALVALAILLLLVGVGVNVNSFVTTKKIEAQAAKGDGAVDSVVSGRPSANTGYSETQPDTSAMSKYSVAPDLPKYITINSLRVWSRVVRVGVDSKSQIGTPKNVFDTAWYDGSVKPNQDGTVFIDGHVLGPTKGGVFANLAKIKTGADIKITMGDNKEYSYHVVATEKIDASKVDMAKILKPYGTAKQALVLMTCNGTYLKDSETFDKRLVVYAVRD